MKNVLAPNRRTFLKSSTAASICVAAPAIVPAYVLGKDAPSNTLRVGCIGTGRMGHGDMQACLKAGLTDTGRAEIVAVCDLDRSRAMHAKATCDKQYGAVRRDRARPQIDVFDDYRELLARADIDAVTISTPDHWHALVAIAAANAGKSIYLQKPLTYTVAEGQALVKAVRANKVVLQTGSQQRSDARFHQACELVRNGRIGKVQSVQVVLPPDNGYGKSDTMPVPKQLNYDMWLGPTKPQPYTEHRVHPQKDFSRPGWLQIEAYCRGMVTGWGAHMFDTAQWGLGTDDTGPVEIEATGAFPDRGLFNVHTDFRAEGRYANGVKLIANTGPAGVTFVGERGRIHVTRGSIDADPKAILSEKIGEEEIHLDHSRDHMMNFLQCAHSGDEPICPVEVGHRSNTICVLVHIAMKSGRRLQWDPTAERFVNDAEADGLLDYEHRKPWVL